MKNKKATYILLPVVALVWGLIIYRIFAAANPVVNNTSVNVDTAVEERKSLPDTFSLLANYPDPFLGKITVAKSTGIQPLKQVKKEQPKVVVTQTPWPAISYMGMIKNQKSSKQLVLVMIGGSSNAMKVGDAIDGISLLKIFRDSIEVGMGAERRVVRK